MPIDSVTPVASSPYSAFPFPSLHLREGFFWTNPARNFMLRFLGFPPPPTSLGSRCSNLSGSTSLLLLCRLLSIYRPWGSGAFSTQRGKCKSPPRALPLALSRETITHCMQPQRQAPASCNLARRRYNFPAFARIVGRGAAAGAAPRTRRLCAPSFRSSHHYLILGPPPLNPPLCSASSALC